MTASLHIDRQAGDSVEPIFLSVLNLALACRKRYGWLPKALWESAFLCGHHNIIPGEGKSYCPDCGAGVVYRWHLLRCNGCNARREVGYRLRRWVPLQPFCQHCGENRVTEETLENPRYHQLHYAYLSGVPATEFERQFRRQSVASAWPFPGGHANTAAKPHIALLCN